MNHRAKEVRHLSDVSRSAHGGRSRMINTSKKTIVLPNVKREPIRLLRNEAAHPLALYAVSRYRSHPDGTSPQSPYRT